MTTDPCVYCHQGGDPEFGYRRTCPACKRSYLAPFPRDVQERFESMPKAIRPIRPISPIETLPPAESPAAPDERPAEPENVRQDAAPAVQGSLF